MVHVDYVSLTGESAATGSGMKRAVVASGKPHSWNHFPPVDRGLYVNTVCWLTAFICPVVLHYRVRPSVTQQHATILRA